MSVDSLGMFFEPVPCWVCGEESLGWARMVYHFWGWHGGTWKDGFCPGCHKSFDNRIACSGGDLGDCRYEALVRGHVQHCPKCQLMRMSPLPFVEQAIEFVRKQERRHGC